MFKRVVVALDGSPFAEAALPYAAGLSAAAADLTLLRVAHEGEALEAETYIEDVAKVVSASGVSVPSNGLPAEAILRELKGYPDSLVVMATHGRGGLLETIMGSVASEVVRHAAAPVLLVRPGDGTVDLTERRRIENIVVALDGSEYSERIIGPAGTLAKALDASMKVVQVIPAGTTAEAVRSGDVLEASYVRSRAERIRDDYGITPDWDVLHGDPADAISASVDGSEGTILAMASHARAPLPKAVLGSVTSGCLRRAGVPVLVVGPEYQAA